MGRLLIHQTTQQTLGHLHSLLEREAKFSVSFSPTICTSKVMKPPAFRSVIQPERRWAHKAPLNSRTTKTIRIHPQQIRQIRQTFLSDKTISTFSTAKPMRAG